MQCELMIRQGLVRRVFGEWQRLCQERDWKTQLATRDNEIKRMDREVSHTQPCKLLLPRHNQLPHARHAPPVVCVIFSYTGHLTWLMQDMAYIIKVIAP